MKLSKIMLGTVAALSLNMSHAEYLGIDDLAMKSTGAIKLLRNAFVSQNEQFVEQWIAEKGFSFPYDNKGICADGLGSVDPTDFPFEEKREYADAVLRHERALLPTSCENSIFGAVTNGVSGNGDLFLESNMKAIPTVFTSQKYKEKEERAEVFRKKYLLKYIEGLKDNQWETLPFIVIDTSIDFEVRNKALDKFGELYKNKDKTISPIQKYIIKDAEKLLATNQPYVFKNYSLYSITDPYYFMTARLVHSTLKESEKVSSWNEYSAKKVPQLTKDWFLGKAQNDLKPKDLALKDSTQKYSLLSALKVMQNRDLLLKIKKLEPNLNINKQDGLGNTLLHNILDINQQSLSKNIVAANLLRSLLESGLNPMLLNKDNKSAFEIFDKSLGGSDTFNEVDQAFRLKEYKY